MWGECMGHLNASRAEKQQMSRKTLLKNVSGFGYSVNHNKRTLTFVVGKWNINFYRIAHCGVSKGMGSQPNINKQFISDIPLFYKNFGKEVPLCQPVSRSSVKPETGFDVLT